MLLAVLGATAACKNDPYLPADPCAAGFIDYQAKIEPLIVSYCAMSGCHDAGTSAHGVRLDNYNDILKEVDPFRPENSKLIEVLTASGDEKMPPAPRLSLSGDQVALLTQWVKEGALRTMCGSNCDTTVSITYSGVIEARMNTFCVGCHSGSNPEGGILLTSYANVKNAVNTNGLFDALTGSNNRSQMPPSGMLSDCNIREIEMWIQAGMPQ